MAPLMTPLELKTTLKQVRKELAINENLRRKEIMKNAKANSKMRRVLKASFDKLQKMFDAVSVRLLRKKATLEALAPSIRRAVPIAVAVQIGQVAVQVAVAAGHVNVEVAHHQRAAPAVSDTDEGLDELIESEDESVDSSENSSGSD
jgi:hypothetical protein